MSPATDTPTGEFSFQLDEFYLDLQEDGSKISILDPEWIRKKPFPGLRPFRTSEFQLFRGRDGQAEDLIKRLTQNHFLAVIGSSGTGKSSLVRAGLIPLLFGGYLQGTGNKWNIAICRPGKDPVENLAIALSGIKDHSRDKSRIYENFRSVAPQLNQSIYGLLEVNEWMNQDVPAMEKPNLLIIIDQFEELFRFDRKDLGKKDIESHFINLLLKAAQNANSGVYVIITMRSEFLGDCVRYRGLPEAINRGQYLVPQLLRTQLKDVIEGPVKLAGKKIEPGLVELLINEIEVSKLKENLDQLPLLQHALMRTYQEAMESGPDTTIGYQHYKAVGEMDKALAGHAEARFNQLGDGSSAGTQLSKKQQIAKTIFQTLTDAGSDQKGGRRPTELRNIYAIARSIPATEAEVDEVVNHFRDADTSFIMPPINPALPNQGLYPDLMMDISHESLMRNWNLLNAWMTEEARNGNLYKTLSERRELYDRSKDRSELIKGFLLKELKDWKGKHPDTAVWAKRYDRMTGDGNVQPGELYRKNMDFLQQSEGAWEEEQAAGKQRLVEQIETAQKEQWRKRILQICTVGSVISLCLALWAFRERSNAEKSAASAMHQKQIAEDSGREARKQAENAYLSRVEAERKRDSVMMYADTLQQLRTAADEARILAVNQGKIFQELKIRAEQLQAVAESQNNDLEKQLAKIKIQKQKFYSSSLLADSTKDSIVKAFFFHPPPAQGDIDLAKYGNMELLLDVDHVLEAREKVRLDPVTALRMADTVRMHIAGNLSKHTGRNIIGDLLLGMFNNNIFNRQEVTPPPGTSGLNPGPPMVRISKDGSRLAWSSNGLQTARYAAGKCVPDSSGGATGVITFTYTAGNTLLVLRDDGKIEEWAQDGSRSQVGTVPQTDSHAASFSPDGHTLVTVNKDGQVNSWNLANLKTGKKTVPVLMADNNTANRTVKQVVFSPDGKRMIRLFSNAGFDVWNPAANQRLTALGNFSNTACTAVSFSTDGNYILAAITGNSIVVIDTAGKVADRLSLYAMKDEGGTYLGPITDMVLSPDLKTLLTRQGTDCFLYDSPLMDVPVIRNPGKQITAHSPERVRRLIGSQSTFEALFAGNNTVVSLGESENLCLWDVRAKFDNLERAFAGVRNLTDLTYLEKLQRGQLSFEDVKRNAGTGNLQTAVSFYDKLKTARLGDIPINYDSVLTLLGQNVELQKILLKTSPADSDLIHSLANNYNDLAYYKLYTRQFSEAIGDALAALKTESSYNITYTNLALAYLLSNQDAKADSIYRAYMREYIPSINKSFKEGFLQDFDDLTTARVIKPDDKRVARIRKMLEEVK